jgi:surface protein
MAITIGNTFLLKLYKGSTQITKLYLGGNLLFPPTSNITDFVTTWRTTGTNEVITIPTIGSGYNYDIETSDGQTFTGVTGDQAITFPSAGDYDVNISGLFPRIYINNGANDLKLIDIKQFGNIVWGSFERSFYGAENLTGSFTDTPNLSNVTDISFMFRDTNVFNGDISGWDVSSVQNMQHLFNNAFAFNQNLNSWNTASLTNCTFTFYGCSSFNQPVSSWDMSSVTSTRYMFFGTDLFNQPLNSWDVGTVNNMSATFRRALVFNQELNLWDTSSVINMSLMFEGAVAFNKDIGSWDVQNVTNMSNMFRDATAFNKDIGSWDVQNTTDMSSMFDGATSFDQNLEDWDIADVTNLTGFLSDVTLSIANYDALLIGWNATLQSAYPFSTIGYPTNISFSGGDSQYTGGGAAASARANLINRFSWTITDGGIA